MITIKKDYMLLLPKTVLTEAKIGDEIKITAEWKLIREDVKLYICGFGEPSAHGLYLIYYSDNKDSLMGECDNVFNEDCYLV